MFGRSFLTLAGVLCLGLTFSLAQDGEKTGGEKKENSKPVEYQPANCVNFGKELGLPFQSLTTLGARIEQARQTPDPLCLALCAKELQVAENCCGKSAPITSRELTEHAVELAKMRQVPAELKAIAQLVDSKQTRQELQKLTQAAQKRQEEQIADAKKGAQPRSIYGQLIVNSNCNTYIDIHYNGRHLGQVPPYGYRRFYVDDHAHLDYFNLTGYGEDGRRWNTHRHGDYRIFTWNLVDRVGN